MATPSLFRRLPTRADPRANTPLVGATPGAGRRWGRGLADRYGFGLSTFSEPPANPNLATPSNFNAQDPAAQGAFGATAIPGAVPPMNPDLQPTTPPPNPTLTNGANAAPAASETPSWLLDRLGKWGAPTVDVEAQVEPMADAASGISTTDRYYARQAARRISPSSGDYQAARRFLRIDGSAPHSARDTMGSQGDQLRPPPTDFAGTMIGGKRAMGFGADPLAPGGADGETTADDVRRDFAYGALSKRYSFKRPE